MPEPRGVMLSVGVSFLAEATKRTRFWTSIVDFGKTTNSGVMLRPEASVEYFSRIFGEVKTLPVEVSDKVYVFLPIMFMIISQDVKF